MKQPATTKEVATGAIRPGSPAASPFSSPYADALLAAMGVRKEALHVASNPVTDSDVPQRVMPVAPNPMLSKAYEQQLFTQLIVALTQGVPNATAQKPRAKSPAPFVSTVSALQLAALCSGTHLCCGVTSTQYMCVCVACSIYTSCILQRGSLHCQSACLVSPLL